MYVVDALGRSFRSTRERYERMKMPFVSWVTRGGSRWSSLHETGENLPPRREPLSPVSIPYDARRIFSFGGRFWFVTEDSCA